MNQFNHYSFLNAWSGFGPTRRSNDPGKVNDCVNRKEKKAKRKVSKNSKRINRKSR